jgi:hypothetical protein
MTTETAEPKPSRVRPSTWAVHPFLIALFPVAFLYRRNNAQVAWPDAARVAFFVLVVAALAVLVMLLVFRNVYRAGVAATGLAVVAMSYGHVRAALDTVKLFGQTIGRDAVLLPIWIVLAALAIFVATRVKRAGPDVAKVLNAGALILFLLTAVPATVAGAGQAGRGAIPSGGVLDVTRQAEASKTGEKLRDIIYICPDDYVGFAMKQAFGYDNEPFLRELEKRGFYVARRARTNYFSSYLSLTSTLDMRYLPELSGPRAVNPIIENNAVVRFLRAKGYRWVYMPGWYDQTGIRQQDDVTYQYKSGSQFSRTFTDTTIAGALTRHVPGLNKSDLRTIQRETTLFQLRNLPRVKNVRGPKFVFAHLMLPHPPFLFEADGGLKTPEEENAKTHDQNYIDHIKFTNAQLLRIVDGFMSGPEETRPIILIQTEEGINPLHNPDDEETEQLFKTAPLPTLDRSFSMLAAYYTPGVDPKTELYPEISPVNSFRAIFNLYFDAKLKPLPDRRFLWERPPKKKTGMRFIDITSKFR